MGFLKEKYTQEYFTGRDKDGKATPFGALGSSEWRAGGIFHEIKEPLDQISMRGRRVLEIGFGRGEAARYLISVQGISKYVGIDFSDAAYSLASDTLSSLLSEDYRVIQGDALELLSETSFNAEFDVVLMLDTIEHIPTGEMKLIYPLLLKALCPGGFFIVDTPFYPIDEDFIAQGYDYKMPSPSDLLPETRGMHCNKFTRDRLIHEICSEGFSVVGDKLYQKPRMPMLQLNNEIDLRKVVRELNGQLWTRRESQLFVPKALLGDGEVHISFELSTTARSAYETFPVIGTVFVDGNLLREIIFDGEIIEPLTFSYIPKGQGLTIEITSNSRLVVDSSANDRSFVLSSFLLIPSVGQSNSKNKKSVQSIKSSARFLDCSFGDASSESLGSGEPSPLVTRENDSSLNASVALVRIDLLSADKRRAISDCLTGDNVVVMCHFKAQSPVVDMQCSLTIVNTQGVALIRQKGLLGSGKTFIAGEGALVMEFCFEIPQLPDGKYLLRIFGFKDVLLGLSSMSIGCMQVSGGLVTLVPSVVLTPPAWAQAGDAPVAQVAEHNGRTLIAIHSHTFRVEPHWFWGQFGSGWELDTFRVFQRYVRSDRPYVDVGAWVGPTLLYAAALGAPSIVAVEANPRTAEHLARTVNYNPALLQTVKIINRCVHKEAGTFNFGNADGSESTSSASSLIGHGFQVQSILLWDLLESTDTLNASLLKIDIEGAEVFIGSDLLRLSGQRDLAIHLSLHPPFWGCIGSSTELLEALGCYWLYWPNGEKTDLSEVVRRSTSSDKFPPWGTAYGNFFEVVLLSKGNNL
jgi:FkbM family methyltransferase